MPIIVCGINHKTAPVEIREKAVFATEKLAIYLADLLAHENIKEAVILSTCNRSELYCDAGNAELLFEWFCRQHNLSARELKPVWYIYHGAAAVQHIMQVACGLDSMVLGEPQVLGQMKEAFSESCAAGSVGPLFNRLFQQVFAVAKDVRANTAIGACPVSVASTAVNLAQQLCPELTGATVLVIGAGDTAELVLRYLTLRAPENLLIANRNLEHANALAKKYAVEVFSLDDLSKALLRADIVISATGSVQPLITKTLMQSILSLRKKHDITLIDIAVPRDIEAQVGELPGVQLRCIDDLKTIIQHNLRGREHAAEKATEVIQQKAHDFIAWLDSLDMVANTISAYRRQIEEMGQAELAKAARQLHRGDDPLQVLASFSHAFTNKLLHAPSVQLRQAGVEGRIDILQLAQQLFAIPQSESELI
ncbi:MAG: glutamyl-tRNA reductase [Pseudomonadota bacterium]